MDTTTLKQFAQAARRQLREQVAARLEQVLRTDSVELREKEKAVAELQGQIKQSSPAAVIETRPAAGARDAANGARAGGTKQKTDMSKNRQVVNEHARAVRARGSRSWPGRRVRGRTRTLRKERLEIAPERTPCAGRAGTQRQHRVVVDAGVLDVRQVRQEQTEVHDDSPGVGLNAVRRKPARPGVPWDRRCDSGALLASLSERGRAAMHGIAA